MVRLGENLKGSPPPEISCRNIETGAFQINGEIILRKPPDNLTVLLDIIDRMPDDMLNDLHDGLPQERDEL